MRIFLEEIKKLFLRNKGYLIIITLIIAQVLIFNFQNKDYNILTNRYQEQYQKYLEVFGGEVSDDKSGLLSAEELRIQSLEDESLNLFGRLYAGKITPDEYDDEISLYEKLNEEKIALTQIRIQYDYAQENKQLRYVMDENGWYTAIQDSGLNIFLICCVILIALRIFGVEYESAMYSIISGTKNGKTKTVFSKILLLLIVIIGCGVVSSCIPIISSQIKFGLYSSGYPIQSLNYFSACPYQITILQGYVLIWSFKILSLCIIGMLAALLCIVFKRSVTVFFISIVVTIIPYFLFNISTILRYVPYLGLFFSEYYFRGIEKNNPQTHLTEMIPLPLNDLVTVIILGIVIFILLIFVSVGLWNNKAKKRRG